MKKTKIYTVYHVYFGSKISRGAVKSNRNMVCHTRLLDKRSWQTLYLKSIMEMAGACGNRTHPARL